MRGWYNRECKEIRREVVSKNPTETDGEIAVEELDHMGRGAVAEEEEQS